MSATGPIGIVMDKRFLKAEIKRLERDLANHHLRSPEWAERLKARIAELRRQVEGKNA